MMLGPVSHPLYQAVDWTMLVIDIDTIATTLETPLGYGASRILSL